MEELLKQINATFDNCMENSNEDTKLQLRILKNNINALFETYKEDTTSQEHFENNSFVKEAVPMVENIQPVIPVVSQESQLVSEVMELNNGKHNVLIVDDSSIVRNYLERVFSEEYNVHLAVDGKDAIDKLSNEEFANNISVILLDLMMPNIDGFGVLEYMAGKQLSIPVMIISGDNSKETINKAFQYNVADVIEKPFDAKKIKDKMNRYVNL